MAATDSRRTPPQRVSDAELMSKAKLWARRALPDQDGKPMRGIAMSGFLAGYMFAHGMKFETRRKP